MSPIEFGANLIATFIGVVLCVPAALWVNRRSQREEEAARRREVEEETNAALRLVVTSLKHNEAVLNQLEEAMTSSRDWPQSMPFEVETWDMVRERIRGAIGDPALTSALSTYWTRLRSLSTAFYAARDELFGFDHVPECFTRLEVVRYTLRDRAWRLLPEGASLAGEVERCLGGRVAPGTALARAPRTDPK